MLVEVDQVVVPWFGQPVCHGNEISLSDVADVPDIFKVSGFQQSDLRFLDISKAIEVARLLGGHPPNAFSLTKERLRELTQAEFDALPQHPLVGKSARLVRVSGDFRGMGGEAKPGFQLLGLVGGTDDEMITLKLVGPKTVVEAEYAHFLEVAASVREASNALPETQQPVVSPGVSPAPTSGPPLQPSGADAAAAPFAATIPATWPPLGDTGSRLLRHRFGKDGECYVGQLGGEIAQMLGVWCGEFAAPVPDAAGIAALPRVPMLSGEAVLLDLKGEHQGMAGQKRPDMRLLVAVRQTEQGIVFCKFLGVAADVELERANFLQFCATLKRSDG